MSGAGGASVSGPGDASAGIDLREAVGLGLMHGPAELLPVSSSGHITVVPWLLRWGYADADPELRKAFEVALHGGTAAALLWALRDEVADVVREASPRTLALIALSFLPPAAAGYLLEGPIERRLGRPGSIACGMVAGAAAMAWADRSPQERAFEDADWRDALWLGFAQACALVPGVSRNGATLAAARRRRFRRIDANRLSRHVALPVIAAATGWKLLGLARGGMPEGAGPAFAAGAGSAFVSTLAARPVLGLVERDGSLLPLAAYRIGVAALVGRRVARDRRARRDAGQRSPLR